MYIKLAVMRWVKLFIVGQLAGQKNVNGKGDHATNVRQRLPINND